MNPHDVTTRKDNIYTYGGATRTSNLRQYVPPKSFRLSACPYGVTTQKTNKDILNAMITSIFIFTSLFETNDEE
jgi:hypothetical protein